MDVGLPDLAAHWREEAETLRRRRACALAEMLEDCATELDLAMCAYWDEQLTVQQAAREGGFSEDHLRSLVRSGQIENAGRKGSPRIRRRDLPMKPGGAS